MPRIEIKGIYQLAEQLYRLGTTADIVADEMLKAGANEMIAAWQGAIEELGLVELGDMRDSLGGSWPKYYGGVKAIDVNPQGYDSKGQPNAYKAWALDKGVPSKNIKAYHHLQLAQTKADRTVAPAMQKVLDQYISTGTVPTIEIKKHSPPKKRKRRRDT